MTHSQPAGPIVVSSRTVEEYRTHFVLSDAELTAGPILDCPGGASEFGAAVRAAGGSCTSVDPRYGLVPGDLERIVEEEHARVVEWISKQPERYRFAEDGLWERARPWRRAADTFLADYLHDRNAGTEHYVAATLPELPFEDGRFNLVLSGFLLFTYSDLFDEGFHTAAIIELLRVCSGEVRLHPLNDTRGRRYRYLPALLETLRARGVGVRLCRVQSSVDPTDDQTLILTPGGS
ncbi:hypothetical protein [Streptomyces sp. SID3343]|uniref:hypothetical protein n=1 Tax=Streptomyces sp. SID3343 TaxID=2690260 RepID=UPI00136F4055|nr:hypothetical protein [Streptomyces sp. SID3343]MYW00605.1 hypothetical protein [Streptomyces sp. SID3343]